MRTTILPDGSAVDMTSNEYKELRAAYNNNCTCKPNKPECPLCAQLSKDPNVVKRLIFARRFIHSSNRS